MTTVREQGILITINPTQRACTPPVRDATYQSVGVETTFDFNVMRFLPKFELGFRTTYRVANEYNSSGVVFEIVIGNIAF